MYHHATLHAAWRAEQEPEFALDQVIVAVEDQFAYWIKPNDTLKRLCAVA